jgi:uracil-DNA glycosylase
MGKLLSEIKKCMIYSSNLALGPRPILTVSSKSKIVIIGQAPGSVVHRTGIAWDDKSGDRLRQWLGLDKETFYNPEIIALIPMGFCYPGKGKTGDLPPRKECLPQWHEMLFEQMNSLELIILIGSYAQAHYLKGIKKKTLTETVKNYYEYLPKYLPLPHPSPRNNIWLKKNPWLERDLIPTVSLLLAEIVNK